MAVIKDKYVIMTDTYPAKFLTETGEQTDDPDQAKVYKSFRAAKKNLDAMDGVEKCTVGHIQTHLWRW